MHQIKVGEQDRQLQKTDQKGMIGADYYITGHAQTHLGRLYINAELTETETSKTFPGTVNGDPGDVLKLVAQLAAQF